MLNKNQLHWMIFIISVFIFSFIFARAFSDFDKEQKQLMTILEAKKSVFNGNPVAIMETNFGEIKLELFKNDAPKTVANFINFAKSGFYDGTKFHRVIKNFMIQGGDPNSKDNDWSNDGRGGPDYVFEDEINSHKITRGVIAMANAGPNTNGSQFFILTKTSAPWLDGMHTVFGKVIEGMGVVDKIENVKTDKSRGDHPIEDVVVKSIKIIE